MSQCIYDYFVWFHFIYKCILYLGKQRNSIWVPCKISKQSSFLSLRNYYYLNGATAATCRSTSVAKTKGNTNYRIYVGRKILCLSDASVSTGRWPVDHRQIQEHSSSIRNSARSATAIKSSPIVGNAAAISSVSYCLTTWCLECSSVCHNL